MPLSVLSGLLSKFEKAVSEASGAALPPSSAPVSGPVDVTDPDGLTTALRFYRIVIE